MPAGLVSGVPDCQLADGCQLPVTSRGLSSVRAQSWRAFLFSQENQSCWTKAHSSDLI